MENIRLLESLFDPKLLRVIRFFLVNKGKEFYLQEIARQTTVPLATVFRIVQKLVSLGIIQEVSIKRFKLYVCRDNDSITFLESFMKEGKRIVDGFVAAASALSGVEEIISHGTESESKANILLIGNNVNSNETKRLTAEWKQKYDFSITLLTLEREQYNQMIRMGLYSGKKKILFRQSRDMSLHT